jgi:hypothetical protein
MVKSTPALLSPKPNAPYRFELEWVTTAVAGLLQIHFKLPENSKRCDLEW